MRRALLLALAFFALAACAATVSPEIAALQNPQYPGDANRDLAAYQARNRDATYCAWASHPGSGEQLLCMARRGWAPRP
jgi:hypothetical protein